MTDKELIGLFFARNESAVKETAAKYGAYCRTVALRLIADTLDAEECVNDTMLAAWEQIPPASPDNLRAYLSKITRNITVKRLQAKNAAKRGGGEAALAIDELSECLPGDNDPQSELDTKELAAAVDAFLRTLPEQEANIFLGRYFYAFPSKEIARRLGIRDDAVRNSLSRTRKKLKEYLEKEDLL